MASNDDCGLKTGDDEHHSEILSSDMGGFLASSCMATDGKHFLFSGDNAPSLCGDSFRIESECILGQSLADSTSVSQVGSCEPVILTDQVQNTSIASLLRTGSLLMYDATSSSPIFSNSMSQIQQSNVVLLINSNGTETRDAGISNSTLKQKPKYDIPQSLHINTSSDVSSNQVIIGNSSAAAFVKSVFKGNGSQPPVSQPACSTPTMQMLHLPPGCIILNTGAFSQPSVVQTSAVPQAPLLIQLPSLLSTHSNPVQGSDIVSSALNIALTSSLSNVETSLESSSASNDNGSTSMNISQVLGIDSSHVLSLESTPNTSFQSLQSSSCTEEEQNINGTYNSNISNATISEASSPSSENMKPLTTSAPTHPVVISGNVSDTIHNRAMQQVIEYFVHKNKTENSGQGHQNTGNACNAADVKVEAENTSPAVVETTQLPPIISINELNAAASLSMLPASLGRKNNSVVLIFGKDPMNANLTQQTAATSSSNIALNTCATEARLRDSSSCGQTIPEQLWNEEIACSPFSPGERDEVDGSSMSVPVTDAPPASELPHSDNIQNETKSAESLKETYSPNNKGAANINKLVPLTVTEKLSADTNQPIIIYVVLKDGETRQININPSSAESACAADSGKAALPTVPGISVETAASGNGSHFQMSPNAPSTDSSKDGSLQISPAYSPPNTLSSAAHALSSDEEKETKKRRSKRRASEPIKTDNNSGESDSKQIKCDLCTATFTRQGNYKRHRKIHTLNLKEDQRFRCPHCDRPFLQRCDMTRHMAIHTNNHPHVCSTCGKGYIRKCDLVVHERFHSKEKAFTCDVCNRSFYQSGDLRRHKRHVHAEEPQFWHCSHCNRKYAKEVTLIRHVKSTHNDILIHITNQMAK